MKEKTEWYINNCWYFHVSDLCLVWSI